MTQPKVKVNRMLDKKWGIYCDVCAPLPGLFSLLRPWVVTSNWPTALTLAYLHLTLHRESHCDHCGNHPALGELQIFGNNKDIFMVGTELFRMTPQGVIRLNAGGAVV